MIVMVESVAGNYLRWSAFSFAQYTTLRSACCFTVSPAEGWRSACFCCLAVVSVKAHNSVGIFAEAGPFGSAVCQSRNGGRQKSGRGRVRPIHSDVQPSFFIQVCVFFQEWEEAVFGGGSGTGNSGLAAWHVIIVKHGRGLRQHRPDERGIVVESQRLPVFQVLQQGSSHSASSSFWFDGGGLWFASAAAPGRRNGERLAPADGVLTMRFRAQFGGEYGQTEPADGVGNRLDQRS